MPTQVYKTQDGTRVPGVTTVIGKNLGWNKDTLIAWAYKQGQDGKDRFRTSQDACDAGTIAHAMAEADIKGLDMPDAMTMTKESAVAELARVAFEGYLQWKRMSRLDLIMAEVPLVSEEHRFGGCIDGIGMIGSEVCLVDFKTSSGVYADHVIQVTAYAHLWNENKPDSPVTSCHLLKFGKEDGSFAHHFWRLDRLNKQWEAFLHLRALHDLSLTIGKAA